MAFISCIYLGTLQAQSFCLKFAEVSNDGSNLNVKIEMNGPETFQLGSSSLKFAYNEDALGLPNIIGSPLGPPNYLMPTVTSTNNGIVDFNIVFEFPEIGTPIIIDQEYSDLGTISFPIIDQSLINEFTWIHDGSLEGTVVYLQDELTQIFPTDLSCLENYQYPTQPDCASLLLPIDESIEMDANTISFEWLLPDVVIQNTEYRVYIDTSPSFSSNEFFTTNGETSQFEVAGLEYSTTYYWTVRPYFNETEVLNCEIFSFTTNVEPDGSNCTNAIPIGEGIFTSAGPSFGEGASNSCFTGALHASWFAYTATVSDSIFITSSIDPNLPDTRLSVHSDCDNLDCFVADDNSGEGLTSSVKFLAVAGETYLIEWDDRLSDDAFDFQIATPIYGCLIPEACNYNASANTKDASCIFATDCDTCSGETDGTGFIVSNPNVGEACDDGDSNTYDDFIGMDCICSGTPIIIFDCTDNTACNYNDDIEAVEDGSCIYASGCDSCSGETDGTGVVIDNSDQGEACDDGDITTADDAIQADCSCAGIVGQGATCFDAIPITEGITYAAKIKGGGGASNACSDGAINALWYVYTATVTDEVTISSSIDIDEPDTRVSIHSDCNNLDCIASDDDDGIGFTSITSFSAIEGETYYIEWDDRWSDGEFDFEISTPQIDLCPTDLNDDGMTNGDDFGVFLGNFGLECDPAVTCLSDFDGNNITDGDDFGFFLGNFGLACESPTPCPTDFDNNETTNGDDFGIFLGNYGLSCAPDVPCPTDLDGNGITNGDDFGFFLGNYGLDCN